MSKAPVARIVVDLMDDGAMSISGNIGDAVLARQMLASAQDAVKARLGRDTIAIPNRDVVVTPDEARFPFGPVVAG